MDAFSNGSKGSLISEINASNRIGQAQMNLEDVKKQLITSYDSSNNYEFFEEIKLQLNHVDHQLIPNIGFKPALVISTRNSL